jgi:hypothetical protein
MHAGRMSPVFKPEWRFPMQSKRWSSLLPLAAVFIIGITAPTIARAHDIDGPPIRLESHHRHHVVRHHNCHRHRYNHGWLRHCHAKHIHANRMRRYRPHPQWSFIYQGPHGYIYYGF